MIGLGSLLVLRLRRDALQLTLWIAGTALLGLLGRVGIANSYAAEQERAGLLAAAVANPVVLLFRGLPSGAGEGAFLAFLLVPWMCILAAFMSSFLAVRHTRGDEEAGRAELVAATPAGMITPLAATILHGLIANAALALLTASALLATGLPVTGSVVVGAAAGAVGVVFLGVGLVAGQIQRTSRGANALAVWTLLATFLACGIGNALGRPSDDLQRIESSWLAWLSPFGWAENTRPFDADALWALLVCAAVALALIVVAASLQRGRDLGESLIPQRSGRATAGRSLRGNASLVWRLSRGAVAGWAVGGLVTGLLSTSLASVVAEVGATNPAVLEIIEQIAGRGNAQQGTIAVFFTMLGVLAACCAVQVVCRARQEETAGTAEAVLASAVHRARWLAGHLLIAAVALVLVIAAGAAGAALGLVAQGGDVALMRDVAVVGGGQAAAASVFLAVTALVFVIAPRGTIALGWTLVALGMVLGLFGPLFGFPEWLSGLSPVGSAPLVDGDAILIRGLWWTLAASGVGLSAALLLMRRRELAGG